MRYSFSGHESFYCKSLWLKKGYDFILNGGSFSDNNAVAELGVGKNMVSSIRFWLKSFGLTISDVPTDIAEYIFDTDNGKDPFTEDINTLWILHYLLVKNKNASIYHLLFLEFQREKREFEREQFLSFIRRKCSVPEQKNVFNENSVKKDIQVLLKNYVAPSDLKSIEDFSSLLNGLNLIKEKNSDVYYFNETKVSDVNPAIILYAIIDSKGEDMTVSFDTLLDISLMFCLPITSLISIIKLLEKEYNGKLVFTDNSGIKNLHFLEPLDKYEVLNQYYNQL